MRGPDQPAYVRDPTGLGASDASDDYRRWLATRAHPVARASKAIGSRLLARGIVADPHKVLAAPQRRVLRGDRRSERRAADDLIYLHTG